MADTEAAGRPRRKPPGWRPDLATIGGIALALAGIVGGLILEKGKLSDILQGTAAMIVLGGTFGAVLVTTPMPVVVRAVKALRQVVLERTSSVEETVDQIILCAAKARKQGIVSLEADAGEVADPFLNKALNLAIDGTDLQEIRNMMELEIFAAEHQCEAEAKVWEAAGGYAPTIGIIGAVLGLIQVMKHLDDIKEVGHGIAVAFVATVYGVGVANIFFLPAASKLRARGAHAAMMQQLMLEGVVGIVEGLNPKLIRVKLEAFTGKPKPAPAPAPAAPAPSPASAAPPPSKEDDVAA
jgi:chemotaxis protein MotA